MLQTATVYLFPPQSVVRCVHSDGQRASLSHNPRSLGFEDPAVTVGASWQ